MKILEILTPPLHFTHQSLLQAEQIRINLQSNLTPKDTKLPIFSLTKKRESYEGEVLSTSFEISRRTQGSKNAFPPIARGIIKENQKGSEIDVEINSPKFVQILVFGFFVLLIINIILAVIFRLIPLSEEFIYLTSFFGVALGVGFIANFFSAKSELKDLKMKVIEFVEGTKKK